MRGQTVNFKSEKGVRNVFVITQFVISIALIIGTLIVYLQLDYMKNKELGFDNDMVITIPIQNDSLIIPRVELFKEELTSHHSMLTAKAQSHLLFTDFTYVNTFAVEGVDKTLRCERYTVDHDFLNTYDIEIVAGRNFSRSYSTDSSALILNETAVKELGFTNEEILAARKTNLSDNRSGQIVGVTKDFHFRSLHDKIQPFILQVNLNRLDYFSVKLNRNDLKSAIDHVQSTWQRIFQGAPFFYEFHDQEFAEIYKNEENQTTLFTWFTAVAIFLGCLGLFGFALFTTERRVKEIGIRKVLGAKSFQITGMLAKDFLILVVIAYIISIPISLYLMDQWLNEFAYRISMPIWVFLLAGLLAGLISLFTISFQSLKAAWSNPTENLKYE